MIGAIICLIVTQDIMVTLFSAFIGIGMACTYALMFPLTFKFGPENSNVIMLTTAVVAVALFLSMWFFAIMPILVKAGSMSKIASNPLVLVATGSYALLGVIILSFLIFHHYLFLRNKNYNHQRVFIEEHTFALFYILDTY